VLDALSVAHQKKVVHRDLKPPNIFIMQAGRQRDFVKVLDFGIARPLDDPDFKITNTGYISGTLPYMAPEVLARNELTPAADVYAAGLVLLEMMFRRYIFIGDNPAQITLQHMRLDPPIPRSIRGSDLEWVVLEAIAKRRDQRYPDADAFLDGLTKARKSAGVDEDRVLTKAEVDEAFLGFDRDMVDDLLPNSRTAEQGNENPTVIPGNVSRVESESATVRETPLPVESKGPAAAAARSDRRPVWPVLVAAVVLLSAATAVGVVATSDTTEPVATEPPVSEVLPPPPDPEPEVPAAPVAKTVHVDTRPSGAEIWIDGTHRMTTPVEVAVTDTQSWEFRKAGFESERATITADFPRVVIELEPHETAIEKPQAESNGPRRKRRVSTKTPQPQPTDKVETGKRRAPMLVD